MSIQTWLRPACLLIPVLLLGCKDPAGSSSSVVSVVILREAVKFEEQTIGLGDVLQLSASVRDATNRPLSGHRVDWSSSDASVASVDGSGRIQSLKLGSAWIRASSGRVGDSARVNVSERFTGIATCATGEQGISLAVGGVHVVSAFQTPTLCVEGGTAGAEYVLVPFHSSAVAGGEQGSRLVAELTASGTVSTISTAEIAASRERLSGQASLVGAGRADEEFHLRLRERTQRELRTQLRSLNQTGGPEPSFATLSSSVSVGDVMRLNVRADSACAPPRLSTARVVAVSNRAVVVADDANPPGGFTQAEYAAFGTQVDNLVYPVLTQTFGEPHDMDGNQRVIIFFTPAVNDLTLRGSGFFVGGFFFDRDLFPKTGNSACAGSNAAEMLYLMVPDPQRASSEPAFSKENVSRRTLSVIGHELQHLINSSRRLHVNKAQVWEEVWLNEGLSHIAEELLFFRVSGLAPRANHGPEILQTHRRTFEEYQLDNFERTIQYMNNPALHSFMASGNTADRGNLPMRGATWSFLRYAADRRGGNERDLWFGLLNSKTSGIANIREVMATDPLSWAHDWTVSLFTDDHLTTADSRFQQPSWNYRTMVPASRVMLGHTSTAYPLTPVFLRSSTSEPIQPVTVSLQSGGAAYYRFRVNSLDRAAVRVTSGGLQAPSKLKVALIRTR
ncbi:hypothetical protein BH23GEM6_BH23GEM6_20650 [soil metagenome]